MQLYFVFTLILFMISEKKGTLQSYDCPRKEAKSLHKQESIGVKPLWTLLYYQVPQIIPLSSQLYAVAPDMEEWEQ